LLTKLGWSILGKCPAFGIHIEQIIYVSKNYTINTLNEIYIINSLEDQIKRLRKPGDNKAADIASKELDELMKKYEIMKFFEMKKIFLLL
jgi:hypothetical protein